VIAAVLALAWATIAGGAVLGFARQIEVTKRARAMAPRSGPRARSRARVHITGVARDPRIVLVGRVFGAPLRLRRARRVDEAMRAQLPVAVDLISVAVGASCTPYQAVAVAARWSPPRIASALDAAVRDTALGLSFDDALANTAGRAPAMRPLTETLRTSARLGAPAAAALARLAQEVRTDVRRRSEARARTVPVRLLFPLVFCVLPAFALLTVVPVLFDGIAF
jgi:tight adherence protein C